MMNRCISVTVLLMAPVLFEVILAVFIITHRS